MLYGDTICTHGTDKLWYEWTLDSYYSFC